MSWGSPRVILVGPRGGANVGAVCRAIRNMDAGRLVIVDGAYDEAEARRMAVHAADVLDESLRVESLRAAIDGVHLVVGTTARTGPWREKAVPLREVAREVACRERASAGGVESAFVFGPEDRGLSNDEIARCHRLTSVPTSGRYRSLNLAQAVLLSLYEVRMASLDETAGDDAGGPPADPERLPADAGDIEDMFGALEAALVEIGFLSETEPGRVMASLRSLLSRAVLERRELAILRGVARQIRWYAERGHEVARAKRARGLKLR